MKPTYKPVAAHQHGNCACHPVIGSKKEAAPLAADAPAAGAAKPAAAAATASQKAPASPSAGMKPPTKLEYPFKEYPESGKIVEVAEGIFWLSTPLPFRLRAINAYLIEEKEGWTIVDCGYGAEGARTEWEQVWQNQMKDKPVTRVVVTHFHPDHFGNAGWMQEKWGVRPSMSETEWAFGNLAAQNLNTDAIEPRCVFYAKNGLSKPFVDQFRNEVFRYPHGCPTVPDSFNCLKDGEVLSINNSNWRVMIGRGHSPEHVCLYNNDLGIMMAGDQVLPEISPNVSVWHIEPNANPLGDFLDTMDRFRPAMRKDTLVLPSHRRPFRGVHDRFDELEHHHHLRLAEIMAATGPAGITAGDLLPMIFPPNLDGHQLGFAMNEALAHLNYLMYEGKLVRRTDAGGIIRFHRT
ncbi:MBL fold metallo-hydrolase [Lacisediminimonas sp.]|uniref:MBL fold metallo-hydrolase n=1 Tax=Lacisediminimonas sp. TaxID=3060582 RepID=UPI00271C2E15|nr:MBL fold metallo-hydrolase [Lacisediminimonas sp.]MDO8298265.1 MBL fold metallo-hydrolase [Lacisediminimonas sp.]